MGDPLGTERLQARGLSLWLEPAEPARSELEALIGGLGEQHGDPRFSPHITVVAEFEPVDEAEALEVLAALALTETPFPVVFDQIEMGDVYWRTLYLAARPDPRLQGLFERACAALGVTRPAYRPHLSLMYTLLSRSERRQIRDHEVGLTMPLEVVVDRLSLRRTTGAVEAWTEVAGHGLRERRGLGIRSG